MDARSVERAETRLHELRLQGLEDLLLGAAALGGAVVGGRLLPSVAVPLLFGGLFVGFLGLRSLARHFFLVEDLALDRDAYTIPEVRRFALRAASPQHRRRLAGSIRAALAGTHPRVEANRGLLEEIAAALEIETPVPDPAAVVAVDQLLTSGEPNLYSPDLPADELRSRLRRILDALTRQLAA